MNQPPVRELLASYLLKRQDNVLRRLVALIEQSPDLGGIQQLAHTREFQQIVTTLFTLLVQNIADPGDRRCFQYARQRAQERYRQNIPATQMLRLAALHRQVLVKMVQRQFADEPALVRRMTELIESQFNEIELTLADAYQAARDQQWQLSETKYFSLFENASEAIVSFRPGEGHIIEVNMQAERLLGRLRGDLLGAPFIDLFPQEHREEIQWLIERSSGSNMRLEDMAVRRADGLVVPISLSCNWINVDGQAVAQAIMRDMTQQRQMQRELQDHAEQLEERVLVRTQELRQSEERYRALFVQEQRRARHLSLINEVQKYALETADIKEFLHQATNAIQSHFQSCDATFFLCAPSYAEVLEAGRRRDLASAVASDGFEHEAHSPNGDEGCGELIAVAEAGGHGLSVPLGGRHPGDSGLPGLVTQSGETLYITHAASEDPRYLRPPGVHRDAESQLCVPVIVEREIIGVISLQSEASEIFDARDAVALQTAIAIVSAHIQSSRLFREMRELSEFNQSLITTMLQSLMVVDRDGRIKMVNARLRETLRLPHEILLNQPVARLLGDNVVEKHQLNDVLREVTATGTPREIQEVHVRIRPHGQPESTYVFDLRIFRVYFRGEAQAVVLMRNITPYWRKTNQLQLMNEIGRLFQSSLNIDRVLFTVLTCITAGSALGFNRAFLFLRDEGSDLLNGRMALGPSSLEEANWIWWNLSQRNPSLREILEQASDRVTLKTPLQERTAALTIDLNNPCFPALATAVRQRRPMRLAQEELIAPHVVPEQEHHRAGCAAARELFIAPEFAIAPLIAKDRVVGVVIASNPFSGTPIEPDDIQLLETLAQQAGLAIDNALTFQALQKAQQELVSAERLVVVGEMAARVSHEIRNPLATIGGFARSILKRAEDTAVVRRKTGVIVDEVARLEELLTDLLDIARPRPLDLKPQPINDLVEHALLLADADIKAMRVRVEKHLDPTSPTVLVDRSRLLQALLNTLRNGAQAMPDNGTLTVATRCIVEPAPNGSANGASNSQGDNSRGQVEIEVRDTGVGISEQSLKQIFDPFFSTKVQGSGLGLAITRRIIEDHGGKIEVHSQEGQGTTFILGLPLHVVAPASDSTANGVAATDGAATDGTPALSVE